MSLRERLARLLLPAVEDCGHRSTIARLELELTAAQNDLTRLASLLEASRGAVAEVWSLRARHSQLEVDYDALCNEVLAYHPADVAYVGVIDSLRLQREQVQEKMRSMADALELAMGDVAADRTDDQLALMHDAEGGGETPVVNDEPELVFDQVLELPCVLVGIFFEGRSFWHFRWNSERFRVPLHDEDFCERMDRHEVSFTPGDILVGHFRVKTWRRGAGEPWAEYLSLDKVKSVIHPEGTVNGALPLTGTAANAEVLA